ncbi:MAG: FeoB-associated Cys-rich membrane protein [Clostridia bacterium]|nr:FeoB-associated Cys-rich membrane protein [Clostridia bacterium]
MFAWLSANLATIVIVLLLAAAVFFAARHVLRTRKAGGCSSQGSCPHCKSSKDPE